MNTFKRGIGQRLQEIRKTLGLTQEEMGAKLDKGKGSVSKYENGDAEPPYDTLEKYAAMSGRDFNWIFTGKQSHEHAMHDEHVGSLIVSETLTEYVSVPRYEVGASAGGGAIVESEQVVDYLMFSKDWVKSALRASPNNLALINVMGDSMSPSYNDGDLILVDTTVNQPKSDAVYVIQHDSCLWVKRLHFHFDGSIAVISDNSRYPEQTITGEALSRLRIVGRVIWRGGR